MSVAPLSTSTNLTQVPTDLNSLPKEELVRLLKRVADERNDLDSRASKKPKAAAIVTAAAVTPTFNVAATKKRMACAAIKTIKKTTYNWKGNPGPRFRRAFPTPKRHSRSLKATNRLRIRLA
jgi:hypothetical protein